MKSAVNKIFCKIELLSKRQWFVYLAGALPIFFALSPILLGRQFFYHIDVITQYLPYFEFFKRSSTENFWGFLWNPGLLSGFPTFTSYTNAYLTPWSVPLLMFLTPAVAYVWTIFISLSLAAYFGIRFLQKLGLSFLASLVGALSFVLSQWGLVYDVTMVNSLYVLPLLFCALLIVVGGKIWRGVLLGAVGLGVALMNAHWQMVINMLVAAGLFAMFLGLRMRRSKEWLKPVLGYFGMAFGGVVLALPKLVPAYVMLGLSVRGGGVEHAAAIRQGLGVWDFPRFIFPYDISLLGTVSEQHVYMGAFTLMLVMFAFSLKAFDHRGFFSALALGSFLFAVKYSPLFWLIHHLPVFNTTRHAMRWGVVTFFALSVLAAYGVESFRTAQTFRPKLFLITRRLYLFLLAGIAILVVGSSLVLNLASEQIITRAQSFFNAQYRDYISRNAYDFFSNLNIFNPKVLFALAALTIGYIILRSVHRHCGGEKIFIWISIAVILNFILVAPFVGRTMSALTIERVPETAALIQKSDGRVFDFLARYSGASRIEFSYADARRRFLEDDLYMYYSSMLYSNMAQHYGIESASAYETMMSRPMADIVAFAGSERSEAKVYKLTDAQISLDEKISLFADHVALLEFLGVKYVTSPYLLPSGQFDMAFQDRVTSQSVPVYVFTTRNPRPFYYVTDETLLLDIQASPAELLDLLQDAPISQEGVSLLSRHNTQLVFSTDLNQPRLLVVSQNNLPGWQAWIDGQRIPIHTFATVYQAVFIPAGTHEVHFTYSYWEIWREFLKSRLDIAL